MNSKLSRMEKVELRSIWRNEANDFTPWLAEEQNLRLLGEALDIELEILSREVGVGPFRADILCKEVESDRPVLIENQIEGTDHTHLGQLLTYSAGLDASIIIWVAQKFTDEHRAVLDWLNEKVNGAASFFGVEVELWKIAESPPAPRFNVVSKPNDWSNKIKQAAHEGGLSETQELRLRYWTAFLAFLKTTKSPIQCKEAVADYWLRGKSPISGLRCGFEMSVRDQYCDVYFGASNAGRIESLRRVHSERRQEFESEMGEVVEWWDHTEGGKFWVTAHLKVNPSDIADWARQHQWLKETADKFLRILPKYLVQSPA